jgi:hypothetical protein
MGTYNSKVEKRCIEMIKAHFNVKDSEIINPNSERVVNALNLLRSKASLRSVMVFFYLLIDLCDTVVFLTYSDNSIGIGVWGEVKYATESYPDMPIFKLDLKNDKIVSQTLDELLDHKLLTMDETVEANKIPRKNYR